MKVTLGRVPERSGDPPAGAAAAGTPSPHATPPVTRQQVARFLEEALVTGQLDHPGIVPVHELGLDATGHVFFTMKLVRGEDLRAVLARVHRGEPDWTVPRALGLLLRACEAMAYAHDKHVIHRDLKPANIMVGRFGEVYVMDWGLARVLGRPDARDLRLRPDAATTASLHSERHEQASEDSPLVTMDGDIVGTPAYMPPEQARGEIAGLSPASDVYALGAILYHLVSGRMPYVVEGGNNAPRRVLARVEEGPPKPLHEVAPGAPAELVAICERAMAREPGDRYASVVELAEDLRAYLEQRVVKAYETGAIAELRKWVVRNRPLAAAIGAVVVLLAVAVVGFAAFTGELKAKGDEVASANVQLEKLATELTVARDLADEKRVEAESERDRARGRSWLAMAEMDCRDDVAMRAMILRELPSIGDAFVETKAMKSTRGDYHRVTTLRGHEASALSASWSSDGTRIVTVSADGTARVWNADGTGEPLVFGVHQGVVVSAAWSPDGTHIVTAPGDSTARVWNADGIGEPLVLRGHEGVVRSAAWSLDGTRIVTASDDGTARVWNADGTGEPIILRGHEGLVRSAEWSPDGTRIVTASADGTARVWNADDTSEPLVLRGHEGWLRSAAWSPDGRHIVTTSADDLVCVWNADGTSEPIVLRGHVGSVRSAAWSPDGTRIVTASADGTARVWNADGTGEPIVLRGHVAWLQSAAWSPDGMRVVTASDDYTARVWNADGSGEPLVLRGHEDSVLSAAWSPDGSRIVTTSDDGTARVWNPDHAGEPLVLREHEASGCSPAWSPDGRRIVTSGNHSMRVWNADGNGDPIVYRDFETRVILVAWSPDGSRIFSSCVDGTSRVWNADGVGEPFDLRAHEGLVRSAAWSPDGTHIVTVSFVGTARVWSADGSGEPIVLRGDDVSVPHSASPLGELLHLRAVLEASILSVAWSPDGTRLVTASGDGTARVWNADGSGEPLVLRGHEDMVFSAAWSPDGTRLVTASRDGTARVWNADGSGEPLVLRGHKDWVRSATWSPDGTRLVTASDDGTARVWNADGSGEPLVLHGHEAQVNSAAWSPDGTRLVTASDDSTARVWNADGSGEPLVLRGHEAPVNSAAWSPDGTRLVTASDDGTVRIWTVDWPTLRARLWDIIPDLLSPDERVKYLDEPEDVARATYAKQKAERDARILAREAVKKR
ncbi:MAG: serine/threonine protein kinase [Planctomycetes bacterium]|nr:serine/threonine protein kinase [Planctomycetota bacterium]